MSCFMVCLKKYAVFNGRAGRAEFWYFVLVGLIIQLLIAVGSMAYLDALTDAGVYPLNDHGYTIFALVSFGLNLALIIPYMSVSVRRMHDTDRSGWPVAIILLPVLGYIIHLILAAGKSTDGPNRYGEDTRK